MAAGGDDLAAEVALAEGGVAGDDAALQHHPLQQRQGGLVLVGLGRDPGLRQDAAGRLVQGRQEVDGRGAGGAAAAGRLAVDGHGPQRGVGPGPEHAVGPAGDGGLEGPGVEPGKEPPKGAVGRRAAAVAEPVHQLDRLVAAPLGDGRVAAAPAEDGAAGVGQHGDQRVATPGAIARVGDLSQAGEKAARLDHRCPPMGRRQPTAD